MRYCRLDKEEEEEVGPSAVGDPLETSVLSETALFAYLVYFCCCAALSFFVVVVVDDNELVRETNETTYDISALRFKKGCCERTLF